MKNKLVRYFPDQNLSAGYDRLAEIAKENGLNIRTLPAGSFAAFVNRARNRVKLVTGGDVLAYLRLEPGRVIDPRVIQHLPAAFNGTLIDYDKAVKKELERSFPSWFEKNV